MKLLPKRRAHGSVLVISLITCGVIATVLASYLLLLSTQCHLTARSMAWNATIPVLESGIEEALTHLQRDSNPGANGWAPGTLGGQPVNTKRQDFDDGSYANITIYNAKSANPTIYSTGFVPAPLGKGYVSRTVKVTTTKPKAFLAAIAANGAVALSGGAFVDSYNSCLGLYSTNNSLGTNGSIATNSKADPAIKVGNGHVYGTVTTGPGGIVSVNGGAAGDKAWNATHSGIQSGWSDDDMNVAFPTNAPPAGGPFLAPPVVTAGGSNITMVSSGTWQMASLTLTDKKSPMFVTGEATLYVTGKVTVSGNGYIKLFPGARLTLIVGGDKTDMTGGGVVNETGQPANFTYIGLPTNTSMIYAGHASFVGTINAPQANFSISGSAGMFGAAIVNTYTSSGGSSFHYDECLGTTNNFFAITSWREL